MQFSPLANGVSYIDGRMYVAVNGVFFGSHEAADAFRNSGYVAVKARKDRVAPTVYRANPAPLRRKFRTTPNAVPAVVRPVVRKWTHWG